MVANFAPFQEVKPPYRVVTCDGGGIYGLFTALMLRKLCEQDKNFLKAGQVDLFAGTSAGALITLLLARDESPREVVLSGELEEFFKSHLLFSNQLDPVQSITSLMGLTAWSGQKDTMKLYQKHYGDTTIGQLKHRILIATFDFAGRKNKRWQPKMFDNFNDPSELDIPVKMLAYYASSPATLRPVVDGYSDAGIFADNPALNAIAKVINAHAFDQKCPDSLYTIAMLLGADMTQAQKQVLEGEIEFPAFKKITAETGKQIEAQLAILAKDVNIVSESDFVRDLININETYPNDTISRKDLTKLVEAQALEEFEFIKGALTAGLKMSEHGQETVAQKLRATTLLFARTFEQIGKQRGIPKIVIDPLFENKKDLYANLLEGPGRLLGKIQLLSLGIGAFIPSYWTGNFNLGLYPFCLLPTNIAQTAYASPIFNLALDPVTEDTAFELGNLMGKQHFHRLDPDVVGWPVPPVAVACYTARFLSLQKLYVKHIYRCINYKAAKDAINETLDWLKSIRWE